METPLVTITLDEYKNLVRANEIPAKGYAIKTFHTRYNEYSQFIVKDDVSELVQEITETNQRLINEQYELVKERSRLEAKLDVLRIKLEVEQNTPWWKRIFK